MLAMITPFWFRITSVLLGLIGSAVVSVSWADTHSSKTILSENGELAFVLKQQGGQLLYSVSMNDTQVLKDSLLGYRIQVPGQATINLAENIRSVTTEPEVLECAVSSGDASCREYHFNVFSEHGDKLYELGLTLRMFNIGLAFRYEPELDLPYSLLGDDSSFEFPAQARLWHQDDVRSSSHEGQYKSSLLTSIKSGQILRLPITAELGQDYYASISEANLRRDSGLRLKKARQGNALCADFYDASWPGSKKHHSAWRYISVSKGLNALLQANMIKRLSDAPDRELFNKHDFIKPGVALWHWLPEGKYGAKPERQRQYIDAAAEMGFAYSLVDDGWARFFAEADTNNDKFASLQRLSQYARSKGVGLWVWIDVKDVAETKARKIFFSRLHALDIVGIKVDFFDTQYGDAESYAAVRAYQEILSDAAEAQLMVNFHGASKPTGLAITFPNEMTREAVRGQEYEHRRAWINAHHNSILPFTRYLLGDGDYTPVRFNPTKLASSHSTAAHQLALAGLLESSVQNFSFSPENIEVLKTESPAVLQYLRNLPVVWDESRVLPASQIGGMVMIAKRRGAQWYLFAIDGDYQAESAHSKHYSFSPGQFTFLSEGSYQLDIWTDKNRFAVSHKEKSSFNRSEKLRVPYVNAGGFIIKFTPH